MSSIHLSNISIYPIKSSAGIDMSTAWIDDLGLSFDRRFVITDTNGLFITARTDPKICLIQANLTAKGLTLTAPDMPVLAIEYQNFTHTYQEVTVWGDQINAQHCGQQYDQWLSKYLNKPCQLTYFGEQSHRQVKNKTNSVSFADGYPLLLISKASLADLNSRTDVDLTMERFRPNLVVDGCDAFAEDTWQHIRIGEVEFEVSKPCSRCVFTTVDPITAEKHPTQEPLTALKSYRQVLSGDVMFGQNLIQLNHGKINIGDAVTIVSTQQPPVFLPAKRTKNSTTETVKSAENAVNAENAENAIKCINIIDETHDVKTFIFQYQDSAIYNYISGQHLPISLTIDGKKRHSCYTLSSSPSTDKHLSITVKRVKNGHVSNFLHDHFHVGDSLTVKVPAGNFHLKEKPIDKVLLLSAGSGITPMLSMLKTMTHANEQGLIKNDIVFLHSAQTEQDLIAQTTIADLAKRHGNCQVNYTLTQQADKNWTDYQGRLNAQMLINIPDITSRQVFVCGPQAFRDHAQTLLRALGLPDSHFHFESFGQRPSSEAAPQSPPVSQRKKINILFDSWDKYHEGNNKETLLEQGEAAGLIIPYSCRGGMCGSCKVKLESGEVKQLATDALTDLEKEQNYILACSCVPLTDVVITKA